MAYGLVNWNHDDEDRHTDDTPTMIKVRCWIIRSTDKAYCVSSVPHSRYNGDSCWIPKSQLEHVSKESPDEFGWQEAEITMPEWLAEKNKLI